MKSKLNAFGFRDKRKSAYYHYTVLFMCLGPNSDVFSDQSPFKHSKII